MYNQPNLHWDHFISNFFDLQKILESQYLLNIFDEGFDPFSSNSDDINFPIYGNLNVKINIINERRMNYIKP